MQLFVTDPSARRPDVRDAAQAENEEMAAYRVSFIRKIPHSAAGITTLLSALADSPSLLAVAVAAFAWGEWCVRQIRKSVSRSARTLVEPTDKPRELEIFGYAKAWVGGGYARIASESEDAAFSDPDRFVRAVEALEKHILALVPDFRGLHTIEVRVDRAFLGRWLDGDAREFEKSRSVLLRAVAPALDDLAPGLLESLETSADAGREGWRKLELFSNGDVEVSEPAPAAPAPQTIRAWA